MMPHSMSVVLSFGLGVLLAVADPQTSPDQMAVPFDLDAVVIATQDDQDRRLKQWRKERSRSAASPATGGTRLEVGGASGSFSQAGSREPRGDASAEGDAGAGDAREVPVTEHHPSHEQAEGPRRLRGSSPTAHSTRAEGEEEEEALIERASTGTCITDDECLSDPHGSQCLQKGTPDSRCGCEDREHCLGPNMICDLGTKQCKYDLQSQLGKLTANSQGAGSAQPFPHGHRAAQYLERYPAFAPSNEQGLVLAPMPGLVVQAPDTAQQQEFAQWEERKKQQQMCTQVWKQCQSKQQIGSKQEVVSKQDEKVQQDGQITPANATDAAEAAWDCCGLLDFLSELAQSCPQLCECLSKCGGCVGDCCKDCGGCVGDCCKACAECKCCDGGCPLDGI